MQHRLCFIIIFFSLLCTQCTGNECAASQSILTDIDSDCTVDASDNCPSDYNPNQEDVDEDGFGDACEAAECVNAADCVGANFTLYKPYNLRGLYEVSAAQNQTATACAAFDIITLTQTSTNVTVTNENNDAFFGQIDTQEANGSVRAAFQNESTDCQMAYDPTAFSYHVKCYDKLAHEFCEQHGFRTVIEVTTP